MPTVIKTLSFSGILCAITFCVWNRRIGATIRRTLDQTKASNLRH